MESKLKAADTAINDAGVFLRDTFSEEGWDIEIKIIIKAKKHGLLLISDSFEDIFDQIIEVPDGD